jgi:L-threonylcarbamoyladenylate synthase
VRNYKYMNEKDIKKAAEIIKNGGLAAFPTETVYGLGADALNKNAVKKIFKIKNRPFNNPLIVHIASINALNIIAKKVSDLEKEIAKKFWPGPLTIVLKKNIIIPDIVTANLDSVAVRCSADKVLKKIIEYSNTYIAAPSANKFQGVSPTSYQDVLNDFGNQIDYVVKGKVSLIGIESTVLRVIENQIEILRPGPITKEEIEKRMNVKVKFKNAKNSGKKISPGMYKKHYSPDTKLKIIRTEDALKKNLKKYNRVGYITTNKENLNIKSINKVEYINIENGYNDYAFKIYSLLRQFDKCNLDVILVDAVEPTELGVAIMDRLEKAEAK